MMKDTHKRLIEQFVQMAADGRFGDSIATAQREYEQLPGGMAVLLKVVLDFCDETARQEPEIARIRTMACQLLILAYVEAKGKDPSAALTFVHSFIEDYPGVGESSLLPRWCSLAQASLAFREVAHLQNRLLAWQQMTRLFQAYNEFLNGLFAYLIILWRTSLEKSIDTRVFGATYANKIRELSELTNGEDGLSYLFLRLARPCIRNAIAHEAIWLDRNTMKVHFNKGGSHQVESQMDLIEFVALALTGSHLGHVYLAAIAIIAAMEDGTELVKSLIPSQLARGLTQHGPIGR